MPRAKVFTVGLSAADREFLVKLTMSGTHPARMIMRARVLLELDEKGEQVSFMTLLGGFNGLKNTIPRAEGVTMDENGTLYIVSEPNLFYRFEKQK